LIEKRIYSPNELMVSEIVYNESGEVDYQNKYKYDSKGRKIEDIYIVDGKLNSISKFRYQKNDSISMIEVYHPGKKLDFTIRAHYNQDGFNDRDLCVKVDGSLYFWDEYIRNGTGRLEQWLRYNPDSTLQSKIVYKYDSQNREIKNTCSGELGGTYSLKYNEKGLKSEEIAYNTEDKLFLWLKIFSYNQSNRIVKVVEYNSLEDRPGNPEKVFHYQYTYW
jgi:hypothetical protein